ncbi:hypothetical protein MRB53_038641 [Persea americana]|nr:hypothetical protein MRB53_038641 [Persea americana]
MLIEPRLPVLFWSQLLSLVTIIGATTASGYAGFTACRTLAGMFGAPPQVIGLSIIHDMFFFHERARKINIWAFSFLIGPYLGPLCSQLIIEKESWRHTFAVLCGCYGFSLLAVVLLGDETLYDRTLSPAPRQRGIAARVKLLVGITGFQQAAGRPSLLAVLKDQYRLIIRPYLLLPSETGYPLRPLVG